LVLVMNETSCIISRNVIVLQTHINGRVFH
jgi:hypothetical protein